MIGQLTSTARAATVSRSSAPVVKAPTRAVIVERKSVRAPFAAMIASAALLVAVSMPLGAMAADASKDSIRPAICASNPTARICAEGSAARNAAAK